MQNFLLSFSKTTLAFGAIALGIVFIIYANPPHTPCDSQEAIFRESQAGNIFPRTSKNGKFTLQPGIGKLVNDCKMNNSPGGCYELFAAFEDVLGSLRVVPTECNTQIGAIPEVTNFMQGGMALMANLAWGEEPPAEGSQRFGFLSSAEIFLFCRMQAAAGKLYGNEWFTNYRNGVFKGYKGAEGMPMNEIWNRSLFSVRCSTYF